MAEAGWRQPQLTPLSEESLRRLHRRALSDPAEIHAVLERARQLQVPLRNGVDRRSAARHARIAWLRDDSIGLRVENISASHRQLYLSFELEGADYFFACTVARSARTDELVARVPGSVYEAERRDLRRRQQVESMGPTEVELRQVPAGATAIAHVHDWSYDGLGVALPADRAFAPGAGLSVRFLDGSDEGDVAHATIRHQRADEHRPGWVRLGLSVSKAPHGELVAVEARDRILPESTASRTWKRFVLASAPARIAPLMLAKRIGVLRSSASPRIVEYENNRSERIVGIVDSSSATSRGGVAVLIPPSWGRTKETFLPLAKTLVRAFEASGEPVTVLRFDGTNRRGESFIAPRYRRSGDEYLGFRFSQAVQDIHASVDFLIRSIDPEKIVLVTFSLASIEGRRAVATDRSGRLGGWVSVVGMADLQSGLRAVSGGVDYAYGLVEGVSFGRHELVGVLSDMDLTGRDALNHRLVYFEDARRDMAEINVPVTWLHGRHDGWIDLDRIVTLMSSGDTSNRRVVEIPTGHELRGSTEALETFQLIASEVGRIGLGKSIKPRLPSIRELERAQHAERSRRPTVSLDAQIFWRDYVLGREGEGGIGLLTATGAYQDLMSAQVERLALRPGDRVVDLGSGTGELVLAIGRKIWRPTVPRVIEVDLVTEALRRSRERHEQHLGELVPVVRLAADLDLGVRSLPLMPASVHAALASLLVSYLRTPEVLLRDLLRVVRPGGRVVISSLRRDADISKIYVAGMAELQPDRLISLFGPDVASRFEALQREFLNSAAKLVDLEESGRFRFFDGDHLGDLVRAAGFVDVTVEAAFGDPPQAFIASARRP